MEDYIENLLKRRANILSRIKNRPNKFSKPSIRGMDRKPFSRRVDSRPFINKEGERDPFSFKDSKSFGPMVGSTIKIKPKPPYLLLM